MAYLVWTEYGCPSCGRELRDEVIALIHFSKECPYCNERLLIDGKRALRKTKTALVAEAVGCFISPLFVCVLLLVSGTWEYVWESWDSWVEVFFRQHAVIKILFAVALIAAWTGAMELVVTLYVNLMLKREEKKKGRGK